jgi:glycosyltransferase involved in cell wall biosynthesis
VPSNRVSVVHNGVRLPPRIQRSEACVAWRRELGIGDADVLFGTVAVFRPVKDLHTLIEAMALLAKTNPRARLALIGTGRQKEELEAAVTRLGLSAVVFFPGFRRDATQLLGALDVFVLSSLSEGISLALLEAMAAGVPSIATAVGGNLEIISNPSCGLLVPPRSPHDLAAAMSSLADDSPRRRDLIAGGRRRVEEAFSLSRMVLAYEALYRKLANEGGSGRASRPPRAKDASGTLSGGW